MGVLKRLASDSKRVRSGRRERVVGNSSVHVEITDIEDLLLQLPNAVREKAVREANKEAGRLVRNEMRSRAPQSKKTGTASKLSRAKKERADARRFNLSKSIWSKTKIYGTTVLTMVGPRRPDGNHAHLIEFGHQAVYWGRQSSDFVEPRPFMRESIDATRGQQRAAIIKKMKKRFFDV